MELDSLIFVSQQIIMRIDFSRVITLCLIISCIACLSSRHDQLYDYYNYKQPQKTSSGGTSIIGIILGIGFICICGFGCVYCCRRMMNRNANTSSSTNNQYNPNINRNPQYNYPNPIPNQQNQQFYNQRVGAQPPSDPNASINPYIVQNASKINKVCDLCSIKSKIGEQPRIMISCPSQHFFHLSCIGYSVRPPNIVCPRCMQTCPSIITLFCTSCKQTKVVVNICEFTYQTGEVDIDALKAKYGDLCPNCINQ